MSNRNFFSNIDNVHINPSFGSLMQWRKERRSKSKDFSFQMPQAGEKQIDFLKDNRQQASITWIGHATVLIQIGGLNILTDPVWDTYMGFQKRMAPPGLNIKDLPLIDYISISHNHYDHLSFSSIKKLKGQYLSLVPAGLKGCFAKRRLRAEEFDWWQHKLIGRDIEASFVPAQHWSKRSLFDTNKTLWGGWLIKDSVTNKTIYFVGDSGYFRGFKEIGEKYAIDYVLMPIGAYEPEWFMHLQHVSPEDAIQAFIDLKAQHFIPIHFEAFRLGDDVPREALRRLKSNWDSRGLEKEKLKILKLGETILI